MLLLAGVPTGVEVAIGCPVGPDGSLWRVAADCCGAKPDRRGLFMLLSLLP